MSTRELQVGSAAARRGEKVSGFIEVRDGADPGARIPVTVVAGAAGDGPVLALVAGTHGSEPSPIIALQRVRSELDAQTLSGTVIMVHVANVPSFVHRTIYRGPWDQKNLNRVYPGDPAGTTSERIAYAITTEVIERCDYLVDLHSGDGNEALRPYAYWNKLGIDERVDLAARDLALAFGLEHIVVDTGRPRDPRATQFTSNTAQVRGKPALTTEAGAVGVPTEDAIALNVRGAFRVMRHLGMVPGARERVERAKWIVASEVMTSPATGVWYPEVAPDQTVRAGDRIGRLRDYFGQEIADIAAPLDGLVLYVVVSPAMSAGEPIAMIGRIDENFDAQYTNRI